MSAIRVDVLFASDNPDPDTFDGFLDVVVDEFYGIRHEELDYSASLDKYTVAFAVPMAGTTVDSLAEAMADLRTAIHAAGGCTPGWPTSHTIVGSSVEACTAG